VKAGIINLNSGNLLSIVSAVEKCGFETEVIEKPRSDFDVLVMPGQGHFGFVCAQLEQNNWRKFILDWIEQGKKFVGICVGMQVLFESSLEDKKAQGLSVFKGTIEKLKHPKTPMVGWAQLGSGDKFYQEQFVYFVNSYGLPQSKYCVASVNYGEQFCAIVQKDNVTGFQFHPEKSGSYGLEVLKRCLTTPVILANTGIQSAKNNWVPVFAGMTKKTNLVPRIIPCLDVANGRVVKGTNFKQLLDMGDPIELALKYENQGADEIVFLDIKASIDKQASALTMIKKVAMTLSIPFTVGGGIKQLSDVDKFFDAGADKVTLNTAAVESPELINQIASKYGSQSLIVAIDVNHEASGDLTIYTHGGSRLVNKSYKTWINEAVERGAGEILMTAMHKDGTGSGFDLELLKQAGFPLPIIASGGANKPKDFLDAINAGADAVLAAGIFHRDEYSVADVKNYLINNNIKMRT